MGKGMGGGWNLNTVYNNKRNPSALSKEYISLTPTN